MSDNMSDDDKNKPGYMPVPFGLGQFGEGIAYSAINSAVVTPVLYGVYRLYVSRCSLKRDVKSKVYEYGYGAIAEYCKDYDKKVVDLDDEDKKKIAIKLFFDNSDLSLELGSSLNSYRSAVKSFVSSLAISLCTVVTTTVLLAFFIQTLAVFVASTAVAFVAFLVVRKILSAVADVVLERVLDKVLKEVCVDDLDQQVKVVEEAIGHMAEFLQENKDSKMFAYEVAKHRAMMKARRFPSLAKLKLIIADEDLSILLERYNNGYVSGVRNPFILEYSKDKGNNSLADTEDDKGLLEFKLQMSEGGVKKEDDMTPESDPADLSGQEKAGDVLEKDKMKDLPNKGQEDSLPPYNISSDRADEGIEGYNKGISGSGSLSADK